ncbi:MAG TPA: hypothetical protein PK018_04470 [Candidatus Competibacter sp.]|nr:hypothetical protein [Candidatus Competibacteraceae bacterium]HPE71421.1 hypothetical protein [Candidatus Competibacter sp.]HRW64970.1 hypothetical protein [Candidatus Competibacter sp.]
MADNSVPLSVVSSRETQYLWASIAIGKNVLVQQAPSSGRAYWFVVIDRSSLNVVYNQLQKAPNVAPNLGPYNSSDYILIVATIGLGLDVTPTGDLFNFLDYNGAGRELRRIEQIAQQFGCGTMGTFGYALVGVLGDLNQPGFEASNIAGTNVGPVLTLQLMPFVNQGKTVYTPVQLSNA